MLELIHLLDVLTAEALLVEYLGLELIPVLKLTPVKSLIIKSMCFRVNMWGSKFGKELWESLTVATRRDTIQQVKKTAKMIMWRKIMLIIALHQHCPRLPLIL